MEEFTVAGICFMMTTYRHTPPTFPASSAATKESILRRASLPCPALYSPGSSSCKYDGLGFAAAAKEDSRDGSADEFSGLEARLQARLLAASWNPARRSHRGMPLLLSRVAAARRAGEDKLQLAVAEFLNDECRMLMRRNTTPTLDSRPGNVTSLMLEPTRSLVSSQSSGSNGTSRRFAGESIGREAVADGSWILDVQRSALQGEDLIDIADSRSTAASSSTSRRTDDRCNVVVGAAPPVATLLGSLGDIPEGYSSGQKTPAKGKTDSGDCSVSGLLEGAEVTSIDESGDTRVNQMSLRHVRTFGLLCRINLFSVAVRASHLGKRFQCIGGERIDGMSRRTTHIAAVQRQAEGSSREW